MNINQNVQLERTFSLTPAPPNWFAIIEGAEPGQYSYHPVAAWEPMGVALLNDGIESETEVHGPIAWMDELRPAVQFEGFDGYELREEKNR